ncbi:hypothetical protein [Halarcobacter anaerophilus]|jgi:hypothetical protein|uniref:hypothetical protein n=1 Tax=Halarcobacter anaerophilus TaxID=877500 RepID=UPI0005C8A715|nr:hypothetical protein [Halarcobacter anaerophilus]
MKIIRLITAILGGYLLSSLLTVSLTLVLPFSNKAESVVLASMLSFTFWLLFILYSYSSISIKKLLIQLAVVSVLLFLINSYFLEVKA